MQIGEYIGVLLPNGIDCLIALAKCGLVRRSTAPALTEGAHTREP